MESFYATLKGELVEQRDYLTHAEARADIFQFLGACCSITSRNENLRHIVPADSSCVPYVALICSDL